MARRDWLMMLLAFKGKGGPALDPVRIQKGMFLLSQEGELPPPERYEFRPYHYGPYSVQLRSDVDQLVNESLAEEFPQPGYTWSRYALSEAGMAKARRLVETLPRGTTKQLYDIKQEITGMSFNELLRDVYGKYPDYAERSIFTR